MNNVIIPLFLISFIFLILGLIKPSAALFFLTKNKTRKKSLLIFGLLSMTFFILIGVFAPKKNNQVVVKKQEVDITKPKINYLDNRNVKRWIKKSHDIEDLENYIENKIQRKWNLIYSLNNIEKLFYKDSLNKQFIKLNDPTIGFPIYESSNTNRKGSYRIDRNILTIIRVNSDLKTIEEKWKVNYCSKYVLVLSTEFDLRIFYDSENEEKALKEFDFYFAYQKQLAIDVFAQALKIKSNVNNKEGLIIENLALSERFFIIDTNFIENSVINSIKEYLKVTSEITDSILAEKYTKQFEKYDIPLGDYKVNPNYIQDFEDKNLEWAILVGKRKYYKLAIKQTQEAMKKEAVKYKKMYKLYSIYGTGSSFDMTWVADSYAEKIQHNPNSFKKVEGYRTNKRVKDGWVYYIKCRGTNRFGGIVTNDLYLVLQYSPVNRRYFVVRHY